MYLDENFNIVQRDGDQGDTAQRSGFLESALIIREMLDISNDEFLKETPWRFDHIVNTLFIDKKLIRNPIKWSDPNDTSRDQTNPMLIACGLKGDLEKVQWLRPKGWLLLKYQNADVASPADIAVVDRALGLKPSWLGDLWAYFGIRIRCAQAKKDQDDTGDDLNTLIAAVFCYMVTPTKQSTRNLKYYLDNRPQSFGTTKLGEKDFVIGSLCWYFRPETGGNPELANLWAPIIKSLREELKC